MHKINNINMYAGGPFVVSECSCEAYLIYSKGPLTTLSRENVVFSGSGENTAWAVAGVCLVIVRGD